MFKKVLLKFRECFKEVSKVFQESFRILSRKVEGCFEGVFCEFQRYFKEVLRMI